ncbi:MAG: radical SAM protein [Thermoplasmatales archaeon]|nr:MAG: radical SAM protein [Thermoplasmatales archaeon]
MKEIISWLNESLYLSPLSPACKMCAQGSKMVLLVTGLCPSKCFYCPLSFKKGGKDRIFADEWDLEGEYDTKKLISEAEYIDATGAGITGGDPLVVWKRVKKYISLLKNVFGSKFHIHLYTSGLKNAEHLPKLISVGLDEIRFHPSPKFWDDIDKSPLKNPIKNVLDTSADIALEIPAIPDMERDMFSLIKWANDNELRWVNLNELEYSERNCESLENRNYVVKNDISAAVKGSQESAFAVLKRIQNEDFNIGVHYCSVSFKDGIQLKNRIKRRAQNIAKEYEVITKEGTIIKGAIYKPDTSLDQLFMLLKEKHDVSEKFIFLDKEKNRIEIALWILEKIAFDLKKSGCECFMVEEYPTVDRLEVERIPMPF